jgi:hypothetical protein
VIDLSQNLKFCSISKHMPCVTPTGEKYLTSRCRPLHGAEGLRLQGIWLDRDIVENFKGPFLQDLAGNAFEVSSCAVTIFVSMLFSARMHNYRVPDPMADMVLNVGHHNVFKRSIYDSDIEDVWGDAVRDRPTRCNKKTRASILH